MGAQGRWRQRISGGGGGGGSSVAAGGRAAGGSRAVAAAAAQQRHWQGGGGVGSAVAASAEAAWQQRGRGKQRRDGICSAVVALAQRWRQRGSGTTTAGSTTEALLAQGRPRQRISGNDGGVGSSATMSSGDAGQLGGSTAAAAQWRWRQHDNGGKCAAACYLLIGLIN